MLIVAQDGGLSPGSHQQRWLWIPARARKSSLGRDDEGSANLSTVSRCGVSLRAWENPWRLMLAVNVAVVIGVFLHKIALPPYVPYIHLLVDYHFGFIKRALIGAMVSLFTAKIPVWLVFALAGAAGLAVLPEEFHAHARAFRHLRLPARDLSSAGAGAFDYLRAACDAVLDRPGPDPPHPYPDVCAHHRRDRRRQGLFRRRHTPR